MRNISVDLGAIRSNYQALKILCAPAQVMAVVKADAYGHGMMEIAKTLEQIGVDALGVADFSEALQLRRAGVETRLMCWLLGSEVDYQAAVDLKIELGISTFEQLEQVKPRTTLHIKVDTGLGRNGFSPLDWEELFERLAGNDDVYGVFSHLSNTSEQEDQLQRQQFEAALEIAAKHGVSFRERHLAATAGALSYPEFHYDMVRCGIGVYGLNPFEDRELELAMTPAMRVSAELINVKRVAAGQGVSYGYRYRTTKPTNLGLVPFGYAEGMPRVSEGHHVLIAGKTYPVVGRVAMDQFVVDLGDDKPAIGSEAVIFGNAASGEPTAEELGASSGSINYEVVTRIGGRANRVYLNR